MNLEIILQEEKKSAWKDGYREGFYEGFTQGHFMFLQNHIVIALQSKGESVPDSVISHIREIEDLNQLYQIFEEALAADSIDAFAAGL